MPAAEEGLNGRSEVVKIEKAWHDKHLEQRLARTRAKPVSGIPEHYVQKEKFIMNFIIV